MACELGIAAYGVWRTRGRRVLSHYLREGYLHPSDTQLATETKARAIAARKFVDMRMPRIKAIQWRSKQMGNMKKKMGIVQEMLLYLILWAVGEYHTWPPWVAFSSYSIPVNLKHTH